MSFAVLEWMLAGAGLLSLTVFALSFRYAARQTGVDALDEEAVPRAQVVTRGAVDPRFRKSQVTRRGALRKLRMLQAGFIAFGIAAIFFMVLCLVGVVVLMAIGG